MAISDNIFSMWTMSDALQTIRFPEGISSSIPPPGFPPRASDTSLITLFNLMTRDDLLRGHFKAAISRLDQRQLLMIASLLTSDSDYFMEVVRNKYGSKRVQKLLGISDDVDAFFYAAILRHFLHIMTDKYASYVVIRAMVVFDQEKKNAMYEYILHHALDIARDQHGCIALNEIITDLDDPYCRNLLLDVVAHNALFLSNDDASGNFVVQHGLRGHCVDLSFNRYGSYIVEKLLEEKESMVVVVMELLECEEGRLMRLAMNECGNVVVFKALKATKEMSRVDLFWDLVQKLMPFRQLFRSRSHGNSIANILESYSITTRCSS